jgi:hypothetical protein
MDSQQGYVLRWPSGEMAGYLHMATGPRSAWLRVLADPDEHNGAAEVLDHALAVLSSGTLRAHCTVREYEGGIQALLAERGFSPASACSLLVKHTTVQVRKPQRKLVPALEKRAEIATGVSHSESGKG